MEKKDSLNILVACPPGLETLLTDELSQLSSASWKAGYGHATAQVSLEDLATILVQSRLASRVGLVLREFASRTPEMLYDQVRRIDWTQWIRPGQSLAVRATGYELEGLSLKFVPLKIKDAICDEVRKRGQDRPDVDRKDPDVLVLAHMDSEARCRLLLDLSGAELWQRGFRGQSPAEAPLRENRAAALLWFAGLRPGSPLKVMDPFCGSGTILIEAALMSRELSPRFLRSPDDYSAYKILPGFSEILKAAISKGRRDQGSRRLVHFGVDEKKSVLQAARTSLEKSVLKDSVEFFDGNALKVSLSPGTLVVSNPPHGSRLLSEGDAQQLVRSFLDHAKSSLRSVSAESPAPIRVCLLIPKTFLKTLGLRPQRKVTFQNSGVESCFVEIEVRKGGMKKASRD
jgi:23S rRNA (guanine2445-N2)-methyltransferase / 23S rRNA (guanine2069-N7)-methyltransferase